MILRRFYHTVIGGDKDALGDHVISGPLGQSPNKNIAKKKRNPSILATTFQNAWKQGNLTAEVSYLVASSC